jgi:hypothetical protein
VDGQMPKSAAAPDAIFFILPLIKGRDAKFIADTLNYMMHDEDHRQVFY